MKKLLFVAICTVVILPGVVVAATNWQAIHFNPGVTPSSGQCRLESSAITVTLHTFHADVVEEAVLGTYGIASAGDPATLEIRGDFTLSDGSALRSMLLWNGAKILKAKLVDRAVADSAYEAVVDRDSLPPTPWERRDPARIIYNGNNNYQFSIYPVAIGGARKIRILYSVPISTLLGDHRFILKSAFVGGCSQYPDKIPVKIVTDGVDTGSVVLKRGSIVSPLSYNVTYLIPYNEFLPGNFFDNSTYTWKYSTGELQVVSSLPFSSRAFVNRISRGVTSGNYSVILCNSVPSSIKSAMSKQKIKSWAIQARVVAGDESFIATLPKNPSVAIYLKTEEPWNGKIYWSAFDTITGTELYRTSQVVEKVTDSAIVANLPLIWAAKFSLTNNERGLGALYGFADAQMCLLALERDSLSDSLAGQYSDGGMPELYEDEIIVDPNKIPAIPKNYMVVEQGVGTLSKAACSLLKGFSAQLQNGSILKLSFEGITEGEVSVSLFDLSGREIQKWESIDLRGGIALLNIEQYSKGAYLLRVKMNSMVYSARVFLN